MLEDGSLEIELNIGSFDQHSLFVPNYENWILRRESWLAPIPGIQNETDRAAKKLVWEEIGTPIESS